MGFVLPLNAFNISNTSLKHELIRNIAWSDKARGGGQAARGMQERTHATREVLI